MAEFKDYAANDFLFLGDRYGRDKVNDDYEARILYIDMSEDAVEQLKHDEATDDAAKALMESVRRHISQVSESGWYRIYGAKGYDIYNVRKTI